MLCPVCQVELAMADRQGVEIDYCPKCRGVWLDRGELDKIIERTATEVPEPRMAAETRHEPRRDYDNYRRDHDYKRDHKYQQHHHRKKKSLLSDLFDF